MGVGTYLRGTAWCIGLLFEHAMDGHKAHTNTNTLAMVKAKIDIWIFPVPLNGQYCTPLASGHEQYTVTAMAHWCIS